MYQSIFNKFVEGADTLHIYSNGKLIFSSKKDRLVPLLDYLSSPVFKHQPVVIFDKIGGNAAALLAILANCRELFSPLGSELAIATLKKSGVKYHFTVTVPFIQQPDGVSMCPMEKLSVGKKPVAFYAELTSPKKAGTATTKEASWTR